jgi:hypothetical protein
MMNSEVEPRYPFMIMNRHYIAAPDRDHVIDYMPLHVFENGRFKEKAVVIDILCRRFAVRDVINVGRVWNPLNWSWKFKKIKVKYVYGPPKQLTFEQARSEYIELVCKRGWFSQDYENEAQFRQRVGQIETMENLLDSISYLGKWLI